ncbi:hypothetical protein OHA61_22865 [Streptomyces sp. NBC_00885]|uniref:hypothetical protein n=1 Tax=Streptomyces sp. NBC_00885 TaxID=2975857 RepID=UPI00386300A4|nr:hypothetical protein OHA61_22865 [Streptomyces sp. NBC_00885]
MLLAAGPFYTSGTFWAATAVIVAMCAGAGAMWATLRASNPKRQLTYAWSDTALLRSRQRLNGELEIRLNGAPLMDPRVVRVSLANTSRRDIGSTHFDRAEPIRFRFGTPILKLLGTEVYPSTSAPPPATADGAELLIGPGRLGRGETVIYHSLIDGVPDYEFQQQLIDVTVLENPGANSNFLRLYLRALRQTWWVPAIMLPIAALLAWLEVI